MEHMPIGFHFFPTEEEITFYYLKRKVNGEPLPPYVVIDCDIYGNNELWKIFNQNSKKSFYVFTKLKKRGNAGRVERAAGCDTWKGQNKIEIKDEKNKIVEYKKLFVFEVKGRPSSRADSMATNGHWLMHEFSLLDGQFNDVVLCEIRNNGNNGQVRNNSIENEVISQNLSGEDLAIDYLIDTDPFNI